MSLRFPLCVVVVFGVLAESASAQSLTPVVHDLTLESMLRQADLLVKAVMGILVLASVTTLSIWIYKVWDIVGRRRAIARSLASLSQARTLATAGELPDTASRQMVAIALDELQRVPERARQRSAEGIKERVAAFLLRVEAGHQRRLSRGLSVLGTIGAAAPFIGLFGTVWGIMNSFIGITKTQTTNLAVVAPGIAEALLATAFGLVAAIPAVLIYNGLTRAVAGYRVRMNDASTHVMCLLSRELDAVEPGAIEGGVARGV